MIINQLLLIFYIKSAKSKDKGLILICISIDLPHSSSTSSLKQDVSAQILGSKLIAYTLCSVHVINDDFISLYTVILLENFPYNLYSFHQFIVRILCRIIVVVLPQHRHTYTQSTHTTQIAFTQ